PGGDVRPGAGDEKDPDGEEHDPAKDVDRPTMRPQESDRGDGSGPPGRDEDKGDAETQRIEHHEADSGPDLARTSCLHGRDHGDPSRQGGPDARRPPQREYATQEGRAKQSRSRLPARPASAL